MAQEFTPQQLQKLLQYASRRLNTSPEALVQAFRQGGLEGVARQTGATFSGKEAEQARSLLQKQGDMQELLQNPQVRQLLADLMGEQ